MLASPLWMPTRTISMFAAETLALVTVSAVSVVLTSTSVFPFTTK